LLPELKMELSFGLIKFCFLGLLHQLKKVNLKTGAVTVLSAPKTDVPNGMALDNNGNLLVTQQGDETEGGFRGST
jgi:hypothetical protein